MLTSSRLLRSLLALDVAFVVIGFVHRLELLSSPVFALSHDSGLAETAQYGKVLATVVAATFLYRSFREPVYLAIAGLMAALFLDDVTQFHETAGESMSRALGLPAVLGLRAQDLGEVLALAVWAVPLLAAGVAAYFQSGDLARRHARLFGLAVVALAGFGVVADMVHQAFSTVWGLSFALEVVEEGGEMVTMSVIVAGLVAVARRPEVGVGR